MQISTALQTESSAAARVNARRWVMGAVFVVSSVGMLASGQALTGPVTAPVMTPATAPVAVPVGVPATELVAPAAPVLPVMQAESAPVFVPQREAPARALIRTSPIPKPAIAVLPQPLVVATAPVSSTTPATPATPTTLSTPTATAPLQLVQATPALPDAAGNQRGAPAGFTAPDEPKPDETNAQRAKTQPLNNAPFWRGVQQSGEKAGVTNLPGPELGVLVQRFVQYPGSNFTTAGEAWRQVRNQWILPYGGALLAITVLALAMFYWSNGSIGGHEPDTGRKIERFTPLERAAHWTNAIAFVVLGVSGLVMSFGKFILMPVIGHTLFGWLTYLIKNAHNFAGPLFAVSLVIVFITFIRDNFPSKDDLAWVMRAGGLFGGAEVASHRFNAGEKIVFWGGVFGLGATVVASGLVLDKVVPGLAYLRGDLQIAQMVHGIATLLMVAMFLGHIYMGTIGMKGAYSAMRSGYVDEAWAKEHHALWYTDIKAGKIPAHRSTAGTPMIGPAVGSAR